MSLVREILRTTAKYHPFGYQGLYERLYNETIYGKRLNKRSLSAIVSRMKKKGLLQVKKNKLVPTKEGLSKLEKILNNTNRRFSDQKIDKTHEIRTKRNTIITFDIPEGIKLYREWLRSELVGFNFTMVQKSVWFGPPLPKEFIAYLEECGLLKYIRFFHAKEDDLI